jgi:8-oxo-dGTP pyrophosphatase MutT (NUDIX family)
MWVFPGGRIDPEDYPKIKMPMQRLIRPRFERR